MANCFNSNKEQNNYTSEFNEAKSKLYRIHLILLTNNVCSIKGDLNKWRWNLDALFRELSPDASKKDRNKFFKENETLNFKIQSAIKEGNTSLLYNLLNQKEIFLRCLMDSVGMGTKWKDSTLDELD